jgi:hypothetical protein
VDVLSGSINLKVDGTFAHGHTLRISENGTVRTDDELTVGT